MSSTSNTNTNSLVSNFSNLFSMSNPNTIKTPSPPSKPIKISPTPQSVKSTTPSSSKDSSVLNSIKSVVQNPLGQSASPEKTTPKISTPSIQSVKQTTPQTSTQPSVLDSIKSTVKNTFSQSQLPKTPTTPLPSTPKTSTTTSPKTSPIQSKVIPPSTFIKDGKEITISINNTLWTNLANLMILIFTFRNFMIFTILSILLFLSYNIFLYNVEKTDFFKKHLGKGMVEIFRDIQSIIQNTFFGIETAADTVTTSIGLSNKPSNVVPHEDDKNKTVSEDNSEDENKSSSTKLENKIDKPNYETIYEKEIKSFEKALGDFDKPKEKGWCYVGSDRGYRSCVEVSEQDACLSKDIYPRKDLCENPTLRI